MTKPDDPVYPITDDCETAGITLREHFASLAMQGILAGRSPVEALTQECIAAEAVELADALIDALNGAGKNARVSPRHTPERIDDEHPY